MSKLYSRKKNIGSKLLPRLHIFEFEDLSWFPVFLRNYLTDYLNYTARVLNFFEGLSTILKPYLNRHDEKTIIDLGSGGGGGIYQFYSQIKSDIPDLKIVLTDLYPNIEAMEKIKKISPDRIDYTEQPVDATKVPNTLKGFRTMFRSFHHLRPDLGRAVITDAVLQREPIGIFETQGRSLFHMLSYLTVPPILVLLVTPLIRPFSLGRLVFTYLIPVMPLVCCWDGVVTVFRTYTADELSDMVKSVRESDSYEWEIGQSSNSLNAVRYLIGYPKPTQKHSTDYE